MAICRPGQWRYLHAHEAFAPSPPTSATPRVAEDRPIEAARLGDADEDRATARAANLAQRLEDPAQRLESDSGENAVGNAAGAAGDVDAPPGDDAETSRGSASPRSAE